MRAGRIDPPPPPPPELLPDADADPDEGGAAVAVGGLAVLDVDESVVEVVVVVVVGVIWSFCKARFCAEVMDRCCACARVALRNLVAAVRNMITDYLWQKKTCVRWFGKRDTVDYCY